ADLASRFDPLKVSKSPARFDVAELEGLNSKLIHDMPYEVIADRVSIPDGVDGEQFWNATKGNLSKVTELGQWNDVVAGEITPLIDAEDRDMITAAANSLPAEPWDETSWKAWTTAVKADTGRKGKSLFMPLRKAITGSASGPDLSKLLPLIGRKTVLARLA
ncbi:MAG: glutamate--tRNA ligase, partial [Rhizobiales bacterium]|nr:glutamate--tRNA ligase [Hyphomicrobiales bacterium]